MLARVERFEAKLNQSEVDAFLVTGQNNIYYLTGFWGTSATVFISKSRRLFVTDARYTLIAKQSVQGFDIIESRDALQEIVKVIQADNLKKLVLTAKYLLLIIRLCRVCLQVMIW